MTIDEKTREIYEKLGDRGRAFLTEYTDVAESQPTIHVDLRHDHIIGLEIGKYLLLASGEIAFLGSYQPPSVRNKPLRFVDGETMFDKDITLAQTAKETHKRLFPKLYTND